MLRTAWVRWGGEGSELWPTRCKRWGIGPGSHSTTSVLRTAWVRQGSRAAQFRPQPVKPGGVVVGVWVHVEAFSNSVHPMGVPRMPNECLASDAE